MTHKRKVWNIIFVVLAVGAVAFAGVRCWEYRPVAHLSADRNTPLLPASTPAITPQAACHGYWDSGQERCRPMIEYLREKCAKDGGRWDIHCHTADDDRREACRNRGGIDDGNEGCIEAAERAQCEGIEGRWEEEDGRRRLRCIGRPEKLECEQRGGRWHVGFLSQCYEADALARCATLNGTMKRTGLGGMLQCLVVAPDADKPCTDGSQCSNGTCLYRGDNLALKKSSGLAGTCKADNNAFGCFMKLKQGRIVESYCAD